MSKILFFQEDKAKEYCQVLLREFQSAYPSIFAQIQVVKTIDELRAVDFVPKAILCYWPDLLFSHYFVEIACQSPGICQAPLIILHDELEVTDIYFLSEYKVQNLVKVSKLNPSAVAARILDKIRGCYSDDRRAKVEAHTRKFYDHLHAGRFPEAEAVLHGHLKGYCSDDNLSFYQATILKAMKRFDEAIAILSRFLERSINKLDIRFVHLIGNIEFKRQSYQRALQFLNFANKVSPRNMRRRFILAQCYYEMGDPKLAMIQYSYIFKTCPVFPGVHMPTIEIMLATSGTPDLTLIGKLITHLNAKQLNKLAKKVSYLEPENRRRIVTNQIIRQLSTCANDLIEQIDFYGALKLYQQVQKMVDPGDGMRNRNLLYCMARAYYRAQEFENAIACVDKAATIMANGSVDAEKLEKIRTLALARCQKRAS